MNGFSRFIQYHNAVPIALGILVLGGASVFAAAEPERIFSTEQKIVSVDNTYIAEKDISSFTPEVQVTNVTEDAENYFVVYTFKTIDVQDYVWRDVVKNETMTVAKSVLGEYGDLGVYVAGQLGQNIDHEIDRLKEAQTIERRNITQKTVATAYGGLVGKLLDNKTEVFPGYTPVVTPPPPPAEEQVAAAAVPQDAGGAQDAVPQSSQASAADETSLTREEVEQLIRERVAELLADSTGSMSSQEANSPRADESTPASSPQQTAGTSAPIIGINGNNPARLTVGSSFGDLGAVITGPTPSDTNLGIHTFLDGVAVDTVQIDTSVAGTHTIDYVATNSFGTATTTRTVIVSEAEESSPAPASEPAPEQESGASQESSSNTPQSEVSTVQSSSAQDSAGETSPSNAAEQAEAPLAEPAIVPAESTATNTPAVPTE